MSLQNFLSGRVPVRPNPTASWHVERSTPALRAWRKAGELVGAMTREAAWHEARSFVGIELQPGDLVRLRRASGDEHDWGYVGAEGVARWPDVSSPRLHWEAAQRWATRYANDWAEAYDGCPNAAWFALLAGAAGCSPTRLATATLALVSRPRDLLPCEEPSVVAAFAKAEALLSHLDTADLAERRGVLAASEAARLATSSGLSQSTPLAAWGFVAESTCRAAAAAASVAWDLEPEAGAWDTVSYHAASALTHFINLLDRQGFADPRVPPRALLNALRARFPLGEFLDALAESEGRR